MLSIEIVKQHCIFAHMKDAILALRMNSAHGISPKISDSKIRNRGEHQLAQQTSATGYFKMELKKGRSAEKHVSVSVVRCINGRLAQLEFVKNAENRRNRRLGSALPVKII